MSVIDNQSHKEAVFAQLLRKYRFSKRELQYMNGGTQP